MSDGESADATRGTDDGTRETDRGTREADRGDGWHTEGSLGSQRRRDRLRTVGIGVSTGLLAGMCAFMYTRAPFVPAVGPVAGTWYPSVLAAVAGGFVYLLAVDARQSIAAGIVGFLVGVATIVTAWMAPLWLLGYPPVVRDLYIRGHLQETMPGIVTTLILVYWGGYLTTLLVAGYLDV